ncbi:hypothetical protein L0657_06725 [Dyadobacter sp. CY345]|uniref:hypothetical protein n=1 Tax=Dyadobacter sp. CY345 TaxID=2909335 RepID=UPI001F274150|nr:hypothetical protein [Dyadobacter sp. CY345]MCF2443644.1 hypothetical protein [Dyadobacter sp. CY345]
MKIANNQLQLKKTTFIDLFLKMDPEGKNLRRTFDRIESICIEHDIENYYNTFESFKTAFHSGRIARVGN